MSDATRHDSDERWGYSHEVDEATRALIPQTTCATRSSLGRATEHDGDERNAGRCGDDGGKKASTCGKALDPDSHLSPSLITSYTPMKPSFYVMNVWSVVT